MHLLSAVGTFIKPLALKFSNNRYHLFYLFSPTNQITDRSVGHAVSLDMVHWEHQSVILLNANTYHPIGIYCDVNNVLGRFPGTSSENYMVYYHNDTGTLCANYWDYNDKIWPLLHDAPLPFDPKIEGSVIGIANDIVSCTQAALLKSSDSLVLYIYSSENQIITKTTVDGLIPQDVKSVRLDIGKSLSDGDNLVILLTAYIQSSNRKSYIKYHLCDEKLIEVVRTSELGTTRRMLSLASGRILEFGVSDGARELMTLPCEVYINNTGLIRNEPLEVLNCFSQSIPLESGSFTPIANTFRIIMACHSLIEDQSITLALFANQSPLLEVRKLANNLIALTFGYEAEAYSHIGTVTDLEILVDGGIVEFRNNNQPVFVLNFGKVNSITPSIVIFPPQVKVTIASLFPEIKKD